MLWWEEGEGREDQKVEVARACEMLEGTKRKSAMARNFVEELEKMLRQHGVGIPVSSESDSGSMAVVDDRGGDADFESLLQSSADLGADLGLLEWDKVLASINSYTEANTDMVHFTICTIHGPYSMQDLR